jgi:hypothetical protein
MTRLWWRRVSCVLAVMLSVLVVTQSLPLIAESSSQQTPVTSAPTGSEPSVTVQEEGEQSGTLSLSLEQRWSNALFLANATLESVSGYLGRGLGVALAGIGLAAACYLNAASWDSGYYPRKVDLWNLCGVVSLALGAVGALFFVASGASAEMKWEGEIARLQAIGQQKGWVYLGMYIPDPTQSVYGYGDEGPAHAFGRLIDPLLRDLSSQ